MANAAFLVDSQIRELTETGTPLVDPFDPASVQAASIDLALGSVETIYTLPQGHVLGQELDASAVRQVAFQRRLVEPGETIYVALQQSMSIPKDCLGFVFPRSSFTRLGILIQPVFMNPGYNGKMPITITNAGRVAVTIVPGIRVAQLVCARLSAEPSETYEKAGKYAGEQASGSLLHSDADIQATLNKILRSAIPAQLLTER